MIQLLNEDSAKLKASYALNAFIHQASMDPGQKITLLKNLTAVKSVASTEYAKIFLESQLTLLNNQTNVEKSLAVLPRLPQSL